MSSTLWLLKIRNRANPKLSLIAVLNSCERFSQDSVRLSWYITIFDIALARNSVNLSYHLRGLTMSSTSSLTKLINTIQQSKRLKYRKLLSQTQLSIRVKDSTVNQYPVDDTLCRYWNFKEVNFLVQRACRSDRHIRFTKRFLLFLSHRLSISILNLNLVKNHLVFYTKLIVHTMNESVISVMERK